MSSTRGSKRRRVGASDAAAAASSAKALVDSGHAERLRAGLQETRINDGFDELPANIKIRVCLRSGGSPDDASSSTTSAATALVKVAPNVAAALSRPLANMLVGPMASVSPDGVLTLGADCGVNAEALQAVVDYMYSGTLELLPATTFEVLSATNFLELEVAKGLCVTFLCDSLRPETALSMVAAGAHFNSPKLEEGAHAFVTEHFEDVSKHGEFLAQAPAEARSLVRLDTLRVPGEMAVLDAVARWADSDAPNREAAYAEMFEDADAVRLS
ncbi:MAG: BTB/POZ domain-containing protein, partial [Deltaproteobacteria bacterium]|nr:BTB/POZ domain-containing protein [Deltaproteobacteria bacterium]